MNTFKNIVMIFCIVLITALSAGCDSTNEVQTIEHSVRAQDTWWDIAWEYKTKYNDNRDVREIIAHSQEINGCLDNFLRPGDIVKVAIIPQEAK